MTESLFIGWDIGGAHLKMAVFSSVAGLLSVHQIPCPLWRGVEELEQAMHAVLQQQPSLYAGRHAVTMTGELADCFNERRQGVTAILETVSKTLGHQDFQVFANVLGLTDHQSARRKPLAVASANWLVTAQLCADTPMASTDTAIVVDVGSTTTDLTRIRAGVVVNQADTDAGRLTTGELIYTGVVRTPVMAFCRQVSFSGRVQSVMAELFATAADVHRLTGKLPDACDQAETADGRGKDELCSARRLARMLGRDVHEAGMHEWRTLAGEIAGKQARLIADAVQCLLPAGSPARIIGAGCGRFLLPDLAASLGCDYQDIADLFAVSGQLRSDMAQCAPAACLAMMASAQR